MGAEPFEESADDLPPLSMEQEDEILLTYLSAVIADMDHAELCALRGFARSLNPGSKGEDAVTQLIDGQLSVREIRELP